MTARNGLAMLGTVALFVGCGESTAPEDPDFTWSAVIDQGDAIEIKGVNGSINLNTGSGSAVAVSAVKRGQQSNPAEVDIEVVTHAGGVTICAVYPDTPGQPPNECAPGAQGHISSQDNDVEVTFWVLVPPGVDFVGTTVNGSFTGSTLESEAFATTVNGDVTITTTELATARTVNGSIDITLGLPDWGRDLLFTTVNGNVRVRVPSASNADVRLTTTNGSISSDFSLTEVGTGDFRGTIGTGGPDLFLATVNGNVALEGG